MIIRQATPDDAAAMTGVLNQNIAIGGTTAHQIPKSVAEVLADYVTGPHVKTAVVAEVNGQLIGWQSVEHWQGDNHIGTFVQPGLQAKGVGVALFAMTCDLARRAGIPSLVASIRTDNVPGMAYYGRLGFVTFAHDADFALNDGQVVGRFHRRFAVV